MIVTCQNCDARFSLNDALVKTTGSKVRCSKCKHVFVIYPDAAPEPEMLSTEAGPESFSAPQAFHVGEEEGAAPEVKPRLGDPLDGGAVPGEDLDLSEIEKMLATDGQDESDEWGSGGRTDSKATKEKSPAVESPAVSAGALDLSEIEKIFDMEDDLDDADRMRESEPEDLLFDMEESAIQTKEPSKELGDFDIADIEKMLEEEMVESETDETGGLLYTPVAPLFSGDSADEKVEDVEEPFSFSEIEEMMEKEAAVDADAEEELTVALDGDDRLETPSTESLDAPDFSMLDELLKEKAPESSDEASLELDIAEIAPISSTAVVADDLELNFDGIDMEDREVAGSTVSTGADQPVETEDLDLEFNDEQLDEALVATEETAKEPASPVEEEDAEKAEAVETDSAAFVAPDSRPAEARQSRKGLIFVLVLVLLTGAAVGGYLLFGDTVFEFLNKKGIEIPLLSELKKPAVPDAGNLKITTVDIDSRFVENNAAGRLFVVSGKARNGYADSRSLIRITGKLYVKGKQLVNSETAYCGNVMTVEELSTLSLEEIKTRLENPKGNNDANLNIKPGEERPFMVVFSTLPENLEEFTLEVAGSESAARLP